VVAHAAAGAGRWAGLVIHGGDPTARELFDVRIPAAAAGAGRLDVQSGVARRAGVLWCTRHRAERPADTAVIVVHPSSSFMAHYALVGWAGEGVDAIGMSTRYLGNESTLLLENCVLDIGAVVRAARDEGYERVVLVGNSGGGGLAALYQEQAEHPSITSSPCGGGPDLTAADLPPVDGLVMLMAHPGRASVLTEKLDGAIVDEHDPFVRDESLDLFAPGRPVPFEQDFLDRYAAAQVARNDRISEWARQRLDEVLARTDGRVHDLPFVVHGTHADPRALDVTIDPSDRKVGQTQWGPPDVANLIPATLGHYTSLRSWLSQWSNRYSNGNGPDRLSRVDAPVHVIYGTADPGCYPGHARSLYDAVAHDRKLLTPIVGGGHYLDGQPEQRQEMCSIVAGWAQSLSL